MAQSPVARWDLKEFLTRLLPGELLEGVGKKIFRRNKKPREAKVFACYVYISQNSSFRRSRDLLEDLGVRVAHSAVWYWFHGFSESAKQNAFAKRKRRVIIVDETEIRTKKGWIYVFAQ